MERSQILNLSSFKLFGMRSARDEVMAAGIKRQHEPPTIVGDLFQSEIAGKQAGPFRHQMAVAKLPLAKDIELFDFTGSPINDGLVKKLPNGNVVADQSNAVLIGGTVADKADLTIAIARAPIQGGTRGRFFNVVDPVNRFEASTRAAKQGRMADYLTRIDFVTFNELRYLPFRGVRWPAPLPLIRHLRERTSVIATSNLAFGEWPVRRCARTKGVSMAYCR